MAKLEHASYRLNPTKCEFFKKQIEWMGHKIDQQEIRSLITTGQVRSNQQNQHTKKNEKELSHFW